MRRFVALALAALGLLSTPTPACDLCMAPPPEFTTLQSELLAADTVVIAERTKRGAATRADLVVRTVLRGGADLLPGQRVDPPSAPLGAGVFLLFGDAPRFGAVPARRITDDVATFMTLLANRPELREDDPGTWGDWLAVMAPYLSDRDRLIAASAGLEFAGAPYSAVKAAAGRVSADTMIHALEDRGTPLRNRGALALLVGLGGTEKHAKRLEFHFGLERFRAAPGFDAIVAAYLLLRREKGLPRVASLVRDRLAAGDARTTVHVLAALRFHAQNDDVLSRDQILGAIRPLLDDDAAAPAAILELATLEDWSSLSAVMDAYRRLRTKGPVILGPVARFVHDCPLPEAAAARAEVTRKKRDAQ